MTLCKNCGHSLKLHKKEKNGIFFCDKIVGLGLCCCTNPEPETKMEKPIMDMAVRRRIYQ